jgi:hypothetical protein
VYNLPPSFISYCFLTPSMTAAMSSYPAPSYSHPSRLTRSERAFNHARHTQACFCNKRSVVLVDRCSANHRRICRPLAITRLLTETEIHDERSCLKTCTRLVAGIKPMGQQCNSSWGLRSCHTTFGRSSVSRLRVTVVAKQKR